MVWLKAVNSRLYTIHSVNTKMSMPSLSIVCYKNGFSYMNIPVKLGDDQDKEENKCCECCCQKDAEIKETKIGYLPANVLDGSVSLEADDGNNNDVKIISVSKAKPDNKYSTLIKPTDKFSIKSLIAENIGRQVQINCGFGNTVVGRIKSLELETSSDDDTDPSKAKESFVFFEKKASNGAKVEILVNISKIEEVSGVPEDFQDDQEGKLGTELLVKYQMKGQSKEARANLSFMAFDHVTWTPRYNILLRPELNSLKCEAQACIQCQDIFEDDITFPELVLTGSKTEIKKDMDSFLEMKKETSNTADEEEVKKEWKYSTDNDFALNPKDQIKKPECNAEDMLVAVDKFEYSLKNVTLHKDHPVQVDMMDPITADIYYNVFHIDIGKTAVKKALMFRNNSKHPLTSGSVAIVAKSNEQKRFLENGKLTFTKPGENVVIQTTPCMDILLKVKQEKKELKFEKLWERTLKRKEITITVELENTMKTPATCVIEYSAPGTLLSSDPPVSSMMRSPHMSQHDHNAVTRYTWDLDLGVAEVRQMTLVMVRTTDRCEEEDEPPPHIYN